MADLYRIAGTVYDEDKIPAIARKVYLYDRVTGNKVRDLTTDAYGKFDTHIISENQFFAVAMPDDAHGDASNAKIYDRITPTFLRAEVGVNDIGVPGAMGFGVGICPSPPADFEPMPGHDDPYSDNYGNYRYLDGSILCWIPKFYHKWGNVANGIPMNVADIKSASAYVDEVAAAADGYILHRAFIDGGIIQPGFFIDKYINSINETKTAVSSMPLKIPANVGSGNNGISQIPGFTGINSDTVGIAKLRGPGFHIATVFMMNAIGILVNAMANNVSSTTNCAWYMPTYNYPKGNTNNNGASVASSEDDSLKAFKLSSSEGPTQAAYTGGFNDIAKTTHNGQMSGITEVTGGFSIVAPGFSRLSGDFKILKETVAFRNMTSAPGTPNSLFDSTGFGNYDSIGTSIYDYSGTVARYPNMNVQTYSNEVNRTSIDYKLASVGIFLPGAHTTTAPVIKGYISFLYSVINNSISLYNSGYSAGNATSGPLVVSINNQHNVSSSASSLRSGFYIL